MKTDRVNELSFPFDGEVGRTWQFWVLRGANRDKIGPGVWLYSTGLMPVEQSI